MLQFPSTGIYFAVHKAMPDGVCTSDTEVEEHNERMLMRIKLIANRIFMKR